MTKTQKGTSREERKAIVAEIGDAVVGKEIRRRISTTWGRSSKPGELDRHLAPGESVIEKTGQVLAQGLRDLEKVERTLTLHLTDAQLSALGLAHHHGEPNKHSEIPDFEAIAREVPDLKKWLGTVAAEAGARRGSLLDRACARFSLPAVPSEDLASVHTSGDSASESSPQSSNGTPPVESPDLSATVRQLLASVREPETALGDLGVRLDLSTLSTDMPANMGLPGGPADKPSFFHFHSLQIAFPHVWQEVIDEGLIALAETAVARLGQNGIQFDLDAVPDGKTGWLLGLKAATNILKSSDEPPVEVVMHFPITQEEWTALSDNERSELRFLANLLQTDLFSTTIPPAAQHRGVVLFSEPEFGGEWRHVTDSVNLLEDFNDRTHSLAVLTGKWSCWEDKDYKGQKVVVGPGLYPEFPLGNGLTSLRPTAEDVTRFPKKALDDSLTGVAVRFMARADAEAHYVRARREIRLRASQIVRYAQTKVQAGLTNFANLHSLLSRIEQQAKEPYSFVGYAADGKENAVNFGILVTYRQKWSPQSYQVGRLLSTMALAPSEKRAYKKQRVIKRNIAQERVRNNVRSHRAESTDTTRLEAEIVAAAAHHTNFNLTAGTAGGGSIEILNGQVTFNTSFTKDAQITSNEVKRQFREAVLKAADEYKDEHSVKVTTGETFEETADETGEISNPNDELPVTYLFYELQRRYQVSEEIYGISPVVLVAQELPNPADIDEAWLVRHSWILNRVLLDDSFRPALGFLATGLVGREVALEERRQNLEQQRHVLEALKEEVALYRAQAEQRYGAIEEALAREAEASQEGDGDGGLWGAIKDVGEAAWEVASTPLVGIELGKAGLEYLTSLGGQGAAVEAARLREEAAANAAERAARQERELRERLEREISALEAATDAYTTALQEHLNWRAQISSLRVHVKDNILYYMQAIWSHEPPDQRFLRLRNVQVPRLRQPEWSIKAVDVLPGKTLSPVITEARDKLSRVNIVTGVTIPEPKESDTDPLVEVADLDRMLGYQGNYMVFALRESNALTDFMMLPYRNIDLAVRDPDDAGTWTLEEFTKYLQCLRRHHPEQFADPEIRAYLEQSYMDILTSPRRYSEEVIVPSGSLYIEALPGSRPILEDFKLKHRGFDVLKVKAEVRKMELENVRLAARLLGSEDHPELLEDPEADRRIVIDGDSARAVVETGGD